MNVNAYLFAAYVVIWTILFVFLVVLHRKQKDVGERLKEISREVESGRAQARGRVSEVPRQSKQRTDSTATQP